MTGVDHGERTGQGLGEAVRVVDGHVVSRIGHDPDRYAEIRVVDLGYAQVAFAEQVGAGYPQLTEELGRGRLGQLDLVVCDGDPTADLGVLAEPDNIVLVAQAGRIVKNTMPKDAD